MPLREVRENIRIRCGEKYLKRSCYSSYMMKPKQLLALAGVALTALLIGYGISLIPVGDSANAAAEFGFPSPAYVSIDSHEGDFYILEVHPYGSEEGGGYWVVAKKAGGVVVLIDEGQEYAPHCDFLATYVVPPSLVRYCMSGSGANADVIDRTTGSVATSSEAL